MSSETGETKGILDLLQTAKSPVKPATPTSSRTPGDPTFKALPTPPSSLYSSPDPSSPRTPKNNPSQAVRSDQRLPETPASGPAPQNITPVCPQSEDSLARQKSHSSVAKAAGPHGSTSTGEIKRNQSTVARRKASKPIKDRVSTIIEEINQIRSGKTSDDDGEFRKWTLKPDEYDHLIDRIERNGGRALRSSSTKPLRYEYSTSWNEFSIRMSADKVHSIFWRRLDGLIKNKLDNLPVDIYSSELRTAAQNVQSQGDAAVEFEGVKDRKGPDASFYNSSCTSDGKEIHPPFVIEVNWANLTSKKFTQKAKEYIQLSEGKIRTVVNVDLNPIYQKSNKGKSLDNDQKGPAPAFISVWRSHEGEGHQVATPQKDFERAFRKLDGKPNSDFELVLFLSDFMCQDCANAKPGSTDVMINITAEELCDIYAEGVKKHVELREWKSKQTGRASTRPGTLQSVRQVFSRAGRPLRRPNRLGFPQDGL